MPRARPKTGESGEQQSQAHRSGNQVAKLRGEDRRVARRGSGPRQSDWTRPTGVDRRRLDGGKRPGGGLQQSGSVRQRQKGAQPLKEKAEVWDVDEESWSWDRADQFAMLEKGSGRKGGGPVSLNHLLNFTFAPRDIAARSGPGHRRQSWQRNVGGGMYNKEQYLQANCQFIVREEGDYTVHSVDPDILVDWDLIEQVRMFCHEISSCPICLYPPRAAKITRCGHIFCWPCILHYLALSDRDWRKCPICHEAIEKKDLKSVRSLSNHHFAVGDSIGMQLMARKKHSGKFMPITQTPEPQSGQPFDLADPVAKQFEKLLCISSSQTLKEIICDEEAELNLLRLEMESEDDDPVFVIEALKLLDERKKSMAVPQKIAPDEIRTEKIEGKLEDFGEFEAAAFSDQEEEAEESSAIGETMAHVDEKEKKATSAGAGDDHTYYFYQASDGQHLYIHPINTKCLTKEYGRLTECPHTVTGKIIEIDQITQTEEARKRYRFLRHLPLTCQFALCELELKPPTVSKATLQFFHEELQKRRQQRARKAREERKREKEFSLKRQGVQPPPPLPSEFNTGPDFQEIQTALSPTAAVFIPGGRTHRSSKDFPADDPAVVKTELSSPPSFAQALCEGMEKTSPPSLWPVKARQHSSLESGTSSPSVAAAGGDDQLGGDFLVPSFQDSFTEALTLATESGKSQFSSGKGTKKGKGKQLLFSTGSQRRY